VNEEFKQSALQVADELNIDEIDAARICLEVQEETESSGRSLLTNSIVRFHQRRKHVLDCLRLLVQLSTDVDLEARPEIQGYVRQILQPQNGPDVFAQKCLIAMMDIKGWLQSLAEKLTGASVLGQGQQEEILETIEYQRISLVKQHESLGVTIHYLVKEDYAHEKEFEAVLDVLKKADKYDNLMLHYFPTLASFISRFGGPESGATIDDARKLNDQFMKPYDENPWALPYAHAAFRAWWLAEYSGWYGENYDGSIPENQLEDESRQRSKQYTEALKEQAFDFILAVSADVRAVDWPDPARQGLRQWLQRNPVPAMLSDPVPFSDFFQNLMMEQLETFIEAFITNLPDVLRRLRVDEDEQRQVSKDHEHDLDLERFLVIIAYVFDNRPKAAMDGFWDVQDGALFGFVHWASKRASTPLVATFCEMLQAISGDEDCATAAHNFLLDEGNPSAGKMRRTHSLTWSQIFKELTFFSSKIRDRPAVPQGHGHRPGRPTADLAEAEPESALMLECYLRLITRLCSESAAARTFIAQHTTFNLSELLFQLTSSSILPRLRACAFNALTSLLSNKTKEAGEYIWAALDIWITGGYAPGSAMSRSASSSSSSVSTTTPSVAIQAILRGLATGFEEPNAFVQLLHALVAPYTDDSGLHDGLPFPEQLGMSSRQPGIDPYIDFALGQIFAGQSTELPEIQTRLLQLSCLDLIATCLDTFNDDLVIFADRSKVAVDLAIKVSSLKNYVLLHPFSRVMEWMFNDKVMAALFSAVHQDPSEVARASPDSPQILCLLKGLHVITKILELQPTYLDMIRQVIRDQPNYRRVPVSNAAFGSFEDGILNHLVLIPDLGRYCGTGHPDLVVASLELLEKLSASPRLSSAASVRGRRSDRNKVLAALDDDAETISKILLREMESDFDPNQGPDSPAFVIRIHILDFLIACLRNSPGQPTIAHLLLGFQCGTRDLSIDASGGFSRGVSLFHTILDLVLNSPVSDEVGLSAWPVVLSSKVLQVLKQLWQAPISSSITMTEMQAHDSFFMFFVKELVIQPELLWDGLPATDPNFIFTSSASCLSTFLFRRADILQYLSAELHQVSLSHSPSLKQRIFETLLGATTAEDGQKVDHATIFDWFDFMEPDYPEMLEEPKVTCFRDIDFAVCMDDKDGVSTYNLLKVEELLLLRREELIRTKRVETPQDIAVVNAQAQELLEYFGHDNQIVKLNASRLRVLEAWVQLMLIMIKSGHFQGSDKASFVLRSLQTILPRLESDLEIIPKAIHLAQLAQALIFTLDFGSDAFRKDNLGDLVGDKLFHLFQVSLKAVITLGAHATLKEMFYNISYRYLSGMSDVASLSGLHRRHSIQTIKSAGERFIDLVCTDVQGGEPTCRIAALLVLGALVKLGHNENSKYIIESLVRLNIVSLLTESIQEMPSVLRVTRVEGKTSS
jgi:nuclear pore complex protein Nup205